ncbi:unnamed protein product [Pipistrellus nathusii]|uniref:Uncharacterized protein n=1 Tax=Pipistrellus nathusii TaxID=59473 RepID=A0ABN9ZHT2_PIPNA
MLHKTSMQTASSQQIVFPLVSSCWKGFGNQELSSSCPHTEFCPGQSEASSDHSTELYQSRPVRVSRLQGTKATERFRLSYNLAEPGSAFSMGESEIAVASPNTSQALSSNVGQVYSDPSPC